MKLIAFENYGNKVSSVFLNIHTALLKIWNDAAIGLFNFKLFGWFRCIILIVSIKTKLSSEGKLALRGIVDKTDSVFFISFIYLLKAILNLQESASTGQNSHLN